MGIIEDLIGVWGHQLYCLTPASRAIGHECNPRVERQARA